MIVTVLHHCKFSRQHLGKPLAIVLQMGQNQVMELNLPKFAETLESIKIYALAGTALDNPLYWNLPLPEPAPDDPHIYACYRDGGPTVYVPWLVTAAQIMKEMGLYPKWIAENQQDRIDLSRLAEILAKIEVSSEVVSIRTRDEVNGEISSKIHLVMAVSSYSHEAILSPYRISLALLIRALEIYPQWLPYRVPELDAPSQELALYYEWIGSVVTPEVLSDWGTHQPAGPRMFFPVDEWQAVHNAGHGYVEWYEPGEGGGALTALEIALAGPTAWAAVASMVRAYITRHRYRKVVIYHDGKPLIEFSGDVSVEQVETLLRTLPGASQSSTKGSDAGGDNTSAPNIENQDDT